MPAQSKSSTVRVLLIVVGVLFGGCFLCCGGLAFVGWRNAEEGKAKLAEANRQWDAGQKADAVATYKALIKQDMRSVLSDAERPAVYQRAIEFDLERGDTESAKALVEKSLDKQMELPAANKATADLFAQVRAERAKRAAEEQARREADEKRKQDERVAEAKRKEEERKNAPRLSVELVAVRLRPFRTVQGQQTTMVCVDWKNTGNRPVRWLTANITAYDDRDREVDAIPLSDVGIYAAPSNAAPGVAPGETYATPDDQGRMIPPLLNPRVKRVVVEIVRVEEKGPE